MAAEQDNTFSEEMGQDLSFFMNVSVEGLLSSTPKKNVRKKSYHGNSPFKRPTLRPPQSTVYAAVCKICGKGYKTIRFYKNHMQGHALKDLASKLPDSCAVSATAQEVAAKVVEVIDKKPVVGLHAVGFGQLMERIRIFKESEEWKVFVSKISDCFKSLLTREMFCMPSALIVTSLKIADDILTSMEERDVLLDALGIIADESIFPVLQSFLCEFVLTFADELVISILRFLRNASLNSTVSVPDRNFSVEERQSIFYIGGSILRGFKRLGYTYPNSAKWRGIIEAIQCKLLEEKTIDLLSEQEKKDRLWVEKNNRGGLIFLRGGMQEFLISCSSIIHVHEKDDGLPIETIISKIVSGKPKYDWDAVVGTAIDQDLSFSLMVGIVRSFINTHGKGIILRRMNQINANKATASVTLRHKVAPKT